MIGAMTFRSAADPQDSQDRGADGGAGVQKYGQKDRRGRRTGRKGLTNQDEGHGEDEGEDVASQRLVVLAVTFGEEVQGRVDVVFAQSLRERR